MASDAVYHHLIPRAYMRSWCFKKDSIYIFDKNDKKEKGPVNRNIEHICGRNYYHSIKAGSLYSNSDALEYIFGFLKDYNIELNGKPIDSLSDKNMNFFDYDNWIIKYPNNVIVSRKKRNEIKHQIKQNKYNEIEEQWSYQFENDWGNVIKSLSEKIIQIKSGEEVFLTDVDEDILMKYIVMFDWRGFLSNEQFNASYNLVFDSIKDFFEGIEIPYTEQIYPGDITPYDEFRHALLLKYYDEFLNNKGIIYNNFKTYKEKLTMLFCISNEEDKFITSSNPSFTFINEIGLREQFFVALPNLLILLCKNNESEPNSYKIAKLSKEEVQRYNKTIFQNNDFIILPSNSMELYI